MNNFKYRLFLDDERWPTDMYSPLVICRTGKAFMETIEALGYPEMIYFDNDLGGEIEGKHCAQWLLDRIIDGHEKGEAIPDIEFHVHSQNSVSSKEIEKIMVDIARYRQMEGTLRDADTIGLQGQDAVGVGGKWMISP